MFISVINFKKIRPRKTRKIIQNLKEKYTLRNKFRVVKFDRSIFGKWTCLCIFGSNFFTIKIKHVKLTIKSNIGD